MDMEEALIQFKVSHSLQARLLNLVRFTSVVICSQQIQNVIRSEKCLQFAGVSGSSHLVPGPANGKSAWLAHSVTFCLLGSVVCK